MSLYTRGGTSGPGLERDANTETPRKETPTLELTSVAQLQESTNCIACSEDGMYLSLGHSRGLSVWCASSLTCEAEWLQDAVEITSIQMTRMSEAAYMLGTVDDMGVARVFAYDCKDTHLLTVLNIMENVNKRSICLTFELSEGGDYGAASMSCNGTVWLEVHHFPTEAWLKEIERSTSQNQDQNLSGEVDVKWSHVAEVMKIKAPKASTPGAALHDPSKDLNMSDFETHCLTLDSGASLPTEGQSFSADMGKTKKRNEIQRICTYHFLLPCGPLPYASKSKSQSVRLPVGVCVWWSGSLNVLQYLLQKVPQNITELEPLPDVLWPHVKEILCSAVSRCTRFVSIGLDGALLCIWDRQTGAPLSVVSVSAADSAFCTVQFIDDWPDDFQTFIAAKVQLLVLCKSGALYRVTTGRSTKSSTIQLTERPTDCRDLPTVTGLMSFLQSSFLVVQRNGKMFIQDVINNTTLCFLRFPASYVMAAPCRPVYALHTKQQTLFIKAEQEPRCSPTPGGGHQRQLFMFHFGECGVTREYIVSMPDSLVSCGILEDSCNIYLQQRALSADDRNKAVTQTWTQLHESAVKVQQQYSRATAMTL